jgi:molybdopterin molybdotransferase
MTGAAVPTGADAVVMVEHVETADGMVRLLPPRTVAVGENIVPQGAQAHASDELLKTGTEIQSAQVALAASCGYAVVEVFARPRVAILATGDELVPVAATPGPGQIRNSNGPMLSAMVEAAGGDARVLPIVSDNAAALDEAIALAQDADLILISGGVSAGKFDLVEPALERAGARFHFTGVRIQPGKPTVFGDFGGDFGRAETSKDVCRTQCPFFGLPGNPVSTAVTFLLFAAPVLAALAGKLHHGPRFALAVLTGELKAKPGLTRFLPAVCTFGGSRGKLPEVALVRSEGSGDLAALARSNCFLVVPEEADRIETGKSVRILLH